MVSSEPPRTPVRLVVSAACLAVLAKAVLLVWMRLAPPPPLRHWLVRFDANWFAKVVDHGYSYRVGELSDLAFFPLSPALARALRTTGLDTGASLLAVAWLSTVAAGVLVALVGAEVGSVRVGLLLELAWLCAPRSHVEVMGYSEPLFTALAAATLLMVLRRRWWWAATWCCLAGATRSTGIVLVAVLLMAECREVVRSHGSLSWVRALGVAFLSVLGFSGFWVATAVVVGDPRGYLLVQHQWKAGTRPPWRLFEDSWTALQGSMPLMQGKDGALCVLLFAAGLVLMVTFRERAPLVLYCLLGLLLVGSQAGCAHSKTRLLLPLFPVWLPLARAVARLPHWVCRCVGVVAIVLSARWGVAVAHQRLSP